MNKANHSEMLSLWITATALIATTLFFATYRDATVCSKCWEERIWLLQRWVKKMLNIPQEVLCLKGRNCKSNLKQLGLAIQLYASEHNGKLPSYQNWEQQIFAYLKNSQVYRCPDAIVAQTRYYCMNFHLSGKRMKEIKNPESTILLFECDDSGRPISRHHFLQFKHLCNVVFADGHVGGLSVREVELRLNLERDQQ
ncbi:MAG: DUF1559 domain-containing protein [Armatimonadetes bacterium]|nr:DUF1559 domain-containing protein [Armatimonadota bacterium]